jgi:hypothetical protein
LHDAPPDRLRRIAIAAATLAVDHVSDAPHALGQAVAELQVGTISPTTAQVVADLAERLDDRYLVMHDDQEPGGLSAGWELAFQVARAAAAVTSAYDPDPIVAAREGVYEALAAVGDDALVVETVIATL